VVILAVAAGAFHPLSRNGTRETVLAVDLRAGLRALYLVAALMFLGNRSEEKRVIYKQRSPYQCEAFS
jgi:hypothetical protein